MKNLLFIALVIIAASCSAEEEIRPLMSKDTVDTRTAKAELEASEFHIYLFGSDTVTFTSIVPNPSRVGVFDYNNVEGTPGKFKNSEFYHAGQADELLSEGRLEIRAFVPGVSIDLTYDITFKSGKRVTGSYAGPISSL